VSARRVVKLLHTVAAAGVIGTLLAQMALISSLSVDAHPQTVASVRASVAHLADTVLLPSVAAALISGLLAVIVHRPFTLQGWVWFKGLLALSMFEGSLLGIVGPANRAAEIAARIAAGTAEQATLAEATRGERGSLFVILSVALLNVVIGIWRPQRRTA